MGVEPTGAVTTDAHNELRRARTPIPRRAGDHVLTPEEVAAYRAEVAAAPPDDPDAGRPGAGRSSLGGDRLMARGLRLTDPPLVESAVAVLRDIQPTTWAASRCVGHDHRCAHGAGGA